MLEQLTIKNVAVIDKLSVDIDNGLSVLTGETGAGKSIIIDSINMILGDRAKKELVRNGTERAEVEAVFDMTEPVRRLLEKNDIDCDDDSVIISRKITADGKSSARINGSAVTVNTLRDVANLLINIHGQHDSQALLMPQKHITFLDSYAGCHDELEKYKSLYLQRQQLQKALSELDTDATQKAQRAELLAYQVNEIKTADLSVGEEEELIKERELLERAEEIKQFAHQAYMALYDNQEGMSAYDMISEAVSALGNISDIDKAIGDAYDAVSSAMYTIEESAREVRGFAENVEMDRERLDEVVERLDLINRLKRKYGGTVEAVLDFYQEALNSLSDIETGDQRRRELIGQIEINDREIKKAADALSEHRKKAAQTLGDEIEKSLGELNMEKARFSVSVSPKPYSPDGIDNVEFLISANPGEELKPLSKIASGGELSRVMLAIKSILARTDHVKTMIFDEIDTGVSGAAAQKIADKLKAIARDAQVICITHLPQLAAAADTHFLIEKDIEGERARTSLTKLDRQGRISELARIVGGGAAGIEYAEKILSQS